MVTQASQKVPFTPAIVGQCLCPACPVQAKSACVAGLKKSLPAALAKQPLDKNAIPGVYCSTGKATCSDLNPAQPCICGNCSVFSDCNLKDAKPVEYYCRDGQAK